MRFHAIWGYFSFRGLALDLGASAFQKQLRRWLTHEEWARLLKTAERLP